jgi:hypothetical protein
MDVCLHEIAVARKTGAIVAQFPGRVTEFPGDAELRLPDAPFPLQMGAHVGMIEGEKMGRLAFIVGLLLCGVVWASHGVEAKEAKPAKPAAAAARDAGKKTVCLITEATHRFNLQKIGLTVFANEFKSLPIDGWKLEDKIYGKTKALLGKDFAIKNIPATYEAFAPLREPGGLFRDTEGERAAVIRKIASGSSCDFVLVVMGNASQFGSSNQYVGGLGVLETGNEVFGYARQVHALTFFYVYDGKTFQVLRNQRGESEESTLFKAIHGPSVEVDGEQHASMQALADDPKTRDIVWRLLEKSLELTLPQLFDLRELKATGKTQAEVEKGAAKKNWAPF